MATIQIPALPAFVGTPAASDLLVYRSAGVDFKIDFTALVALRDDTVNIFTAANTFNALTTHNAGIDVDTITAISTVTTLASGLATDTIVGDTGTLVSVNDDLQVNGATTLTNDVTIELSGGDQPLFNTFDNLLNTDIIDKGNEDFFGVFIAATESHVETGAGGGNFTNVVTTGPLGDLLTKSPTAGTSINLLDEDFGATGDNGTIFVTSYKIGGLLIINGRVLYNEKKTVVTTVKAALSSLTGRTFTQAQSNSNFSVLGSPLTIETSIATEDTVVFPSFMTQEARDELAAPQTLFMGTSASTEGCDGFDFIAIGY